MSPRTILTTLFVTLLTLLSVKAEHRPPIMGWASWNHFHVAISEDIIKAQTDAMIRFGLHQ